MKSEKLFIMPDARAVAAPAGKWTVAAVLGAALILTSGARAAESTAPGREVLLAGSPPAAEENAPPTPPLEPYQSAPRPEDPPAPTQDAAPAAPPVAAAPAPVPVPPAAQQPPPPPAPDASQVPLNLLPVPSAKNGITMDFQTFLYIVLDIHPELKMLNAETRAKGETPDQAATLPNPQLSVGIMDLPTDSFSFTKEDMTRKSIGIKQSFYASGKRDLMRKAAEKDIEITAAKAAEKRLEIAEQVRMYFYQLQYLLRTRDFALRNNEDLRKLIDVILAKYSVGMGIQQDVLAAQMEYSKTLEYVIRIDQQLDTLKKNLNALGGMPAETDWKMPKIDAIKEIAGAPDTLTEKAVERRPVFKELNAVIAKAEDTAALARRSLSPDYSVSLSYSRRENGAMPRSDLVSAEVMFDLPFYRSSRENRMIVESMIMADRAREEFNSEKLRLFQGVSELLDMQKRDQKLIYLFDTVMLPKARQAVDAAMAAYRVNKVDFRWLVMNQVELFNYEVQRAQVEFELLSSRAKLMRALGYDGLEAPNEK